MFIIIISKNNYNIDNDYQRKRKDWYTLGSCQRAEITPKYADCDTNPTGVLKMVHKGLLDLRRFAVI